MVPVQMGRFVLALFVGLVLGDQGFELLVTTAGPAVPRTCYAAPGMPNFIDGAYYVAGPAQFELGPYKFQAIFDGFGKMNRFELRGGEVCYTSAWMDTGYSRDSSKQGHPVGVLFEDTQPSRPGCRIPMCNVFAASDNNWVNIIPVGDEAVLLTDSPQMLSMDLKTLNCSSRKTWADDKASYLGPPQPNWLLGYHAGTTGSAHPLQIPGTHMWIDIIAEAPLLFGRPWMDVYMFDGSLSGPQKRIKIGSIQTTDQQYIHSFGLTANHVVLIFNYQLKVNPLTFGTLLGTIQGDWQGIHVMDLKGRWQSFKTKPFFHVHIVNTFENASGIVMDLGFYDELPFAKTPALDVGLFLNKTARDAFTARSGIRRLHLHMFGSAAGTVTSEDLVPKNRSHDFFRVNPEYEGRPYCIYYATEWWHDDESYASMAVLKHNICTGSKAYWSRVATYPGEPSFIGRGALSRAEDDGVVVFVALDGRRRNSLFVTVDAQTMSEISVTELPGHIPFTAHGHFIPSARQATKVVGKASGNIMV